MTKKKVFCYNTEKYHIHSLDRPEEEYTEKIRLIADEGKKLTKDNLVFFAVIDINPNDEYLWQEVNK